jgi:hypothetical protein
MLTRKTAAGIGIGSFVVAIGVYFLIISIMFHSHQVNDTVSVGKNDVFQFNAENHYHEVLNVTGNSFHVKLHTPADGLQVDNDFKKEVDFDWVSLQNGQHTINITNTGDSVLHVVGTLNATTNPIIFTSHLIVIISGILIIGISAAFTVRKPRGF